MSQVTYTNVETLEKHEIATIKQLHELLLQNGYKGLKYSSLKYRLNNHPVVVFKLNNVEYIFENKN